MGTTNYSSQYETLERVPEVIIIDLGFSCWIVLNAKCGDRHTILAV